MAYAGYDLTGYLSLDANERSIVDSKLSKNVFSDDKEAIDQQLEELQSMFEEKDKIQNTLYVTNGLTFFASAYKDLSTSASSVGQNLEWRNALNANQAATLKGGYTANADGGFTIVKTIDDYLNSNSPNKPKETYGLVKDRTKEFLGIEKEKATEVAIPTEETEPVDESQIAMEIDIPSSENETHNSNEETI